METQRPFAGSNISQKFLPSFVLVALPVVVPTDSFAAIPAVTDYCIPCR